MKTLTTTRILCILLGAFLVFYALNQFLHFLPSGYGKMPDFTREYLDGVLPFLPALYILEIILGIILILNKWIPLIMIVLAPLSINFLIFNFANGGWNIISALIVAVLNLVIMFRYREKYKVLLES